MHQRINTQPQTQLDIHLLNTYCILNTDNPKTERAIPPENREPQMAHRLGSGGTWTEKRNTCTKRRVGRRQGRGIYGDSKWRLTPFTIYQEFEVLRDEGTWNRAKRHGN